MHSSDTWRRFSLVLVTHIKKKVFLNNIMQQQLAQADV